MKHENLVASNMLMNVEIRCNEGLTLETSAFQILHGGILTFINWFDGQTFM